MTVLQEINQYFDTVQGFPEIDVETSRGICLAYALHYEETDGGAVVRGIEVPFSIELPVPDDLDKYCRPDKPRFINGIIDCLVERDGVLSGVDFKTTSWASDAYWGELHTNIQLSTYALAMVAAGYPNISWEWDVIEKPGIKQVKLTKKAQEELEAGFYCGVPCRDCDIAEDGKESPIQYGMRVLQWYLDSSSPKFNRRVYGRNESELLEFVYWQHYQQAMMEQTLENGGGLPYLSLRNPDACNSYGKLCEYHPICCGFDYDKIGFKQKEERPNAFERGVSVSQIRCYNSCRQKWKFKYDERIAPNTFERSKSLDTGSLVHAGLEVYLRSKLVNPIVLPVATATN